MKYSAKLYETRNGLKNPFPFYIYKLECKFNQPVIFTHWHEALEILMVRTSGSIILDSVSHNFEPDDLIIVNKETLHAVRTNHEGLIYAIVFDFDFLEFKVNDFSQANFIHKIKEKKWLFPELITSSNPIHKGLIQIVSSLIESFYRQQPGRELKIKCLLYTFLIELLEHDLFRKIDHKQYEDPRLINYIKKSISFMEKNYMDQITVDELAHQVSLSKHHFIRVFKQFVGVSPISYLVDLRLEYSVELLTQKDSITDIAFKSGFNNVSYFIRIFKNKYGMSPNRYRHTL